ncbi:bifunctional 3,4-dihydroxy-2-butanone-4-phosphate synthase/GTP cyclohydrolase II [Celerinatantimonas sp. YJH-8]|uniref:bifunctional 3,4-dihydroxy-2-butanone-4-phosphate synthase/GTP cyclohydrolase II n=1 Tax=Celerinatantimonas sp. YJH-8 TaxID=3228714 RepID=UPI0038BEAAF6
MALSSIEDILKDIAAGKMVVLMDDEDRENEGDLIIAADKVTPEAINFMARYGRGLICLTLTQQRCEQLKLPMMVEQNHEKYATAFTVSIEAAKNVTTGISAADRATTIRAAVASDAKPSDIVMPGHVFPLMAREGGVLNRAGHTEAGVDLARLAGCEPAAAIVEILNEDGSMARRDDLEAFCAAHQIKLGTIADLIEYRNTQETTIERVSECQLPTAYGDFVLTTYRDKLAGQLHFALRHGDIQADQPTLVRVHLHDPLHDLLASQREGAMSWPLDQAMQKLAAEDGILVLINEDDLQTSLMNRLSRYQQEDAGHPSQLKPSTGVSRNVGIGSQILSDQGVQKMRLMSAPKRYHALSGFGLEVVDIVTCEE